MNHNCFTIFLLFDLKKAFDTVNYDIFLRKLNHYGIHGVANDFFSSYLKKICINKW